MLSVGFCTNCMNRLSHLKETFIKNVKVAMGRDDIDFEFILLNYNSQDGMHEWVRDNLKEYIDKGIVKYYKTVEPEHWDMSHAKNVSSSLVSKDYI